MTRGRFTYDIYEGGQHDIAARGHAQAAEAGWPPRLYADGRHDGTASSPADVPHDRHAAVRDDVAVSCHHGSPAGGTRALLQGRQLLRPELPSRRGMVPRSLSRHG